MKTRVAIVRCKDYDSARVQAALAQAIELLGGIDMFVSPGDKLLIKPNLLSARLPDAAVTTHPTVVEAVVDIFRKSEAQITLGDSPPLAGGKEAQYQRLLKATGMLDVAERTGAHIVRFEENVAQVPQPNGRFYHNFEIAQAALDADAIISIPKLKTHGLTYLSCAVKNLFGCVPGVRKGIFHAQAGEDRETFAQMLVDLLGVVKPRLSIVDAITAMDGDGPVDGHPRHLGLILAGTDPVAIDAVACSILGVNPITVDTTRLAAEQGLGVADIANIEIVGEKIEDVRTTEFVEPHSKSMWTQIPKPLRQLLKNQLIPFPYISSKCRNCMACVDACPVKTIERTTSRPRVDLSKCIRCHCCREVCEYSAIDLRLGRLSAAIKLLKRIRGWAMGIRG